MSSSIINAEHDIGLLEEAQLHLWNTAYNFANSMSLKCAVELGIPDIIHDHGKPMTIEELVSALRINKAKTSCVYRLMHILTHSGFFALTKTGYALTPSSSLLLKSNPLNQTPLLKLVLSPILTKSWHYMSTWLLNDDDPMPFYTAHGTKIYDYASIDSEFNECFNGAMACDTELIAHVMIQKCRGVYEGLESLVDVGGGTGNMAKAISQSFPQIECIVFDLPHVIADLEDSHNLKFVGGDMFQGVSSGQAILLKWILHNWNDEECVKILNMCREAINGKEGGKVIIIDMAMKSNRDEAADAKIIETELFLDMLMMVQVKGQQRSEIEWAKLFLDAGFKDYKITPMLPLRSLIEVFP